VGIRVIADSAKSTTGGDTDPGRWQDIEVENSSHSSSGSTNFAVIR
jgi:hypothetical protein